MIVDSAEAAKRVRAARAYAGLTREQLAAQSPLTYKQIKLLESGSRTLTTREELLAVGRACGVPDEFMDIGFSGAQGVYEEIRVVMAVVLSRDMPAILAKARELGVLDNLLAHELGHLAMPGGASHPPTAPGAGTSSAPDRPR